MKEHTIDRNKEFRGIKVKKIAEHIRSNIDNVAKIWEVRKSRIEQKTKKIQTIKHQLKNQDGETIRRPEEIKKEYSKCYKALLKQNQ